MEDNRRKQPLVQKIKSKRQDTREKPNKKAKTKSGKTKCKGCDKDFNCIVNHVKKSFRCQNMYGVTEKLHESMSLQEGLSIFNYFLQ